jgi:molybdopterin converting factor small subunit
MVAIRYRDQFEVSELAGQTIKEAREQFKAEFGIPDKAQVKLNGVKVKSSAECDTVLNDDDKLTFAVSHGRGAFLVGALLLALAITGGIFASGFINASLTLSVTQNGNFANVAPAVTGLMPAWTTFGFYKGSLGSGNIFTVTPAAGYPGDLVTTITIANAADLAKVYRVLSFTLEMHDNTANTTLDVSAGAGQYYAMLTLDNGQANMWTSAGSDNLTVRVKSGFYITHPFSGLSNAYASPLLFAEVAQR